MCGIVAITKRALQVPDLRTLRHMAEGIRHRGPDGEGYLVDEGVGLYHKRLSIIDLAAGHQPMEFGPYSIVFNGEIYNFIELRDDLIRAGHRFVTGSDTEVVLKLYAERGLDFVHALNGMFAILIHDRSQHRLVAIRDRLGIKPLYFRRTDDEVHFASEIKALLRHPGASAELDPDALEDYLTFQHVLGERTLFRGIEKLLPAHLALVDTVTGRLDIRRYWDLRYDIDQEHTETYFRLELRRLVEDSIRLQMRSDVPVGSHLSGGLDSSVVTTLASRHHPAGLHSFHGAFDEGERFDERRYARDVASAASVDLHELVPTARDFVDVMPLLVYHLDEPTAGPGVFPQYMVSRLAASKVKVVLGGQGGDEAFGGYARYLVAYLEQALKGEILRTNDEGEHIVSLASIIPHLPNLHEYLPMLRQFWAEGTFGPMDRRYFRLIDRLDDRSLLSEEVRSRMAGGAPFARFAVIFNHPDTLSYLNKMTHFDLVTGLPALLQVEDRVSMAVSLESRVPLLDHRVLELMATMPPAMKFRGGEPKYIFKRAIGDLVPESVMQRKDKMGFPVPLHIWASGSLREFFSDLLLSRAAKERGIFQPREVEKLLDDERAFGRRLWGVLNLELWHRQFIDTPQPKPLTGNESEWPSKSTTVLSSASS